MEVGAWTLRHGQSHTIHSSEERVREADAGQDLIGEERSNTAAGTRLSAAVVQRVALINSETKPHFVPSTRGALDAALRPARCGSKPLARRLGGWTFFNSAVDFRIETRIPDARSAAQTPPAPVAPPSLG